MTTEAGVEVTDRPLIRAATEADAEAIRDLIHTAELNPRDLDWRRFLVADDGGAVVACAQVRVHGRGTRARRALRQSRFSRRRTPRPLGPAATVGSTWQSDRHD